MEEFRKVIEDLGMVDFKTKKGWFTWTNNWLGDRLVKERIDKFLVSEGWLGKVPFLLTNVVRKIVRTMMLSSLILWVRSRERRSVRWWTGHGAIGRETLWIKLRMCGTI